MTFELSKKANIRVVLKKLLCISLAASSLFLASCQRGSVKDDIAENFQGSATIKLPSSVVLGEADSTVIFDVPNSEADEIYFYIPSEETASSDKVSTIKLMGTNANSYGAQASYATLLALKNQANNQNQNKPSGSGSSLGSSNSSKPNQNVTLIAPNGKLSSLIKNNKYSADTVTVIQSERNDLSEDVTALMKSIKSNSRCDASFIAIRISDGASIGYNVDEQWRCMSTFKAPTALYAYKLASEGKLNLSNKMTYTRDKYY